MLMQPSKANVVVAIPTNGNDGREQMSGVFDYANGRTNWAIQVINARTDIANGVLEAALRKADGLLLSIAYGDAQLTGRLIDENAKLKAVVMNDHLVPMFAQHPRCRTFLIDSVAVGRDAARYFSSLGRFASFGFVHGAIRYPWSIDREEGFRSALPRKTPLYVFPSGETDCVAPTETPSPLISQDELGRWLKALPKPAAVMAVNDDTAARILRAAADARLRVPQAIAVLGSDNDELVCQNSTPTLSSIPPDFEEEGFRAAQMLDALMNGTESVPQPMNNVSFSAPDSQNADSDYVAFDKNVRRSSNDSLQNYLRGFMGASLLYYRPNDENDNGSENTAE